MRWVRWDKQHQKYLRAEDGRGVLGSYPIPSHPIPSTCLYCVYAVGERVWCGSSVLYREIEKYCVL